MCFIKTVYNCPKHPKSFFDAVQNNKSGLPSFRKHETLQNMLKRPNFGQNISFVKNSPETFLLFQLASKLQKNQQQISFIDQTINQCEQTLDDLLLEMSEDSSIDQPQPSKKPQDIPTLLSITDQHSLLSQKEQPSSNILTRQLFGENKKYRYRLQAVNEFDNVIYKERNIKLDVQLKTIDGKCVKNSNIVNLCFALADDNGNWVPLNRVGDPMLKGKTQVELYHGLGEFNKIYTRDISRTFPNGRLNIVVYAKPSMLIYDGLTTQFEQHVDEEMIEPLVIEEVTIKAKKKC